MKHFTETVGTIGESMTIQEYDAVKKTMLAIICTQDEDIKANNMIYLEGFKGLCIHRDEREKLKALRSLEQKFGVVINVPWLEEGLGA